LNIREVSLNPLGERLVDVIIQDYGLLHAIGVHVYIYQMDSLSFHRYIKSNQFSTIRHRIGSISTWQRRNYDEHKEKQIIVSIQCQSMLFVDESLTSFIMSRFTIVIMMIKSIVSNCSKY
jgi:hypothetical protein